MGDRDEDTEEKRQGRERMKSEWQQDEIKGTEEAGEEVGGGGGGQKMRARKYKGGRTI